MTIEQRKLRSLYGNKGIVFTLDAVMAMIVVIILLTFANYYLFKIDQTSSSSSNLQVLKTGSDVMKMLDYNKSFQNYNAAIIDADKRFFLQPNYEMRIIINTTDGRNFDTNQIIPSNRFVGSGSIVMAITDESISNKINPAIGRYWIWVK